MATIKIIAWNVNGIRAALKKDFLKFVAEKKPDILCVQETKAKPEQVGELPEPLSKYFDAWASAERGGYSGVATFALESPIDTVIGLGVPEFDSEGRVIISQFPKFTLFNVYFPNGGQGRHRVEYKLKFYAALLKEAQKREQAGENIIIVGDYNTAHTEIDLARPKENAKTSGFLPEERVWVQKYLDAGFIDTFRQFHPDEINRYSWWDMKTFARARNIGWRIDYILVSKKLADKVVAADIWSDVFGSDHAPVMIELKV